MRQKLSGEEKMEKRNHPRIALKNLSVDASDGVGFFQGMISDASRFGVCIIDLPKRLNEKAKKMTLIVNGQGKNFKMTVRPRWSTSHGPGKSIGAEILNPPWGWTEFIMKFEPKVHDDVWGSVIL